VPRSDSSPLPRPLTYRRPRLHAFLAALGPVIFLVCEAVSALGWTAGTYDYGHNFISDLGARVCGSMMDGREMCSPLWGVMTFGFVAMGLAIGASAILISARLRETNRARRIATIGLGTIIPFGMILIAIFPGEQASVDNGTIVLHVLGAFLAIAAGNTLAIVVGSAREALAFPCWYRPVSVTLGVVGVIALALIAIELPPFDPAIYERIAVYTIFAWHFVTALALFGSASASARTGVGQRTHA
jgi:hypothetical membrane protein